jgi:hypothetical protein
MSELVCGGAELTCTFGAAPSSLVATSQTKVSIGGLPAATIMDFTPEENIQTFGVCSSIANPAVAAATAAALGVLTPMPCIPNTVAPWEPGSQSVALGENPALDDASTNTCLWGGQIAVSSPGQFVVGDVPI